jgi:uncharacterized protein
MSNSFLTAEWRKIILLNYAVSPSILMPYLPKGTELDLWQDKCYVSLVGFLFDNVCLKGIPIPFHRRFPEVNLRFYVKQLQPDGSWQRGVVFIKEIVPKAAVTFVANTLYKEKYQTLPMSYSWQERETHLIIRYDWQFKGQKQFIEATTVDKTARPFAEDSEAAFITEHYWGFSKHSDKKTVKYGVEHPQWTCFDLLKVDCRVDFGGLYGSEFAFLGEPDSVLLAEGSEIAVLGSSSTNFSS